MSGPAAGPCSRPKTETGNIKSGVEKNKETGFEFLKYISDLQENILYRIV
jgi:hypothetical protein